MRQRKKGFPQPIDTTRHKTDASVDHPASLRAETDTTTETSRSGCDPLQTGVTLFDEEADEETKKEAESLLKGKKNALKVF